jgi:hypothetical protein
MTYRGADKPLAWTTSLSIFFSVQITGGSPMGPDPENRVRDHKTVEAQVGQFLLGCNCPVSRFLPGQAKDLSSPLYTIAVWTVKNFWWWTEELSETCRVSFQSKFEELVHLVGFIIRNKTFETTFISQDVCIILLYFRRLMYVCCCWFLCNLTTIL